MCAWTTGGVVNILTVRYACWGRTPLDGARCCPRCSRHACRPLTPSQPHTDPTTLPPFMCMLRLADALSADFWGSAQPPFQLAQDCHTAPSHAAKTNISTGGRSSEERKRILRETAHSSFFVYCLLPSMQCTLFTKIKFLVGVKSFLVINLILRKVCGLS